MRKTVVASVLVFAAATGLPMVTAAAPATGCSAVASSGEDALLTVKATASAIWDGLLDNPFQTRKEFEREIDRYDRNDDGYLCLLTRWGDHLNPNSNWYRVGVDSELGAPVTWFIVVDNNSNARK